MDKKLISICIPILNEEDNIKLIYKKIIGIFDKFKNKYNYEIIFTDNKSSDKSFQIIKEINKIDKNVKCYSFSNNIGKDAAPQPKIGLCKIFFIANIQISNLVISIF